MNLAQVPLLENSSNPVRSLSSLDSNSKEESYFFIPNTPSQRSLMDLELPSSPNIFTVIIMACFPCFIPPLCTTEEKQEYKKSLRTTVVVISFSQVIMFIAALSLNGFESPSENWLLGPPATSLVSLGAKDSSLMKYKYELWRYFTPIFLHAGIIEFFLILFGQMRMGLYLERKWKWYIFLSIYILSGIAGIALSCDARPNNISVGASSAFIGVMGAYLAQLQLTWFKMEGWEKRINVSVCLSFILATFLIGLGHDYVDSFAHLGGLAMGLIIGYSVFGLQYARRWNPKNARAVPILGILLIITYFAVTVILFFTIVPVKDTAAYYEYDYI